MADTDPAAWDNLLVAVAKMPPRKVPAATSPEAGPQLLIEDDDTDVAPPQDPVQLALRELAAELSRSEEAVSLLSWKRGRAELTDMGDAAWLIFSCLQLQGGGMRLSFIGQTELDPFPINESFHDIEVRRPLAKAA